MVLVAARLSWCLANPAVTGFAAASVKRRTSTDFEEMKAVDALW